MKSFVLLSIISVVAAHAVATSKTDSFLDRFDLNPEIRITKKEQTRDCVDFSGTWKGTCKVKDQTKEETISIEQKGCQLIEVTGHEGKKIMLPIGGVMESSVTVPGEPGFTGSGEITSSWNEDHTALHVIMGKSGKKLAVDSPSRGMMVSQYIRVLDGKLNVEFTAYHHKEKTTGACEFSKD
ncbi:MAG: hypothetical protein ACKN9V_09700 [Pseudomonadota bacterium]